MLTEIMNSQNIGMIESCYRLGLLLEAPQAFRIARETRRKNFDGYVTVESRVMSTIHLTHATSTEWRLDLIGPEFGA